jgi:hypothetical protein
MLHLMRILAQQVLIICACLVWGASMNALGEEPRMTELEFWGIVEKVKGEDGDKEHSHRLSRLLESETPERVLAFMRHFHFFESKAENESLWMAASLVTRRHCSEDCFLYFRRWLISRGQSTYERVLKNPDSLSDEIGDAQDMEVQFELFAYPPSKLYEAKTGGDPYAALARMNALPSMSLGQRYSKTDAEMAIFLPRLWARFGAQLVAAKASISSQAVILDRETETVVKGVGRVRQGTVVVHPRFGKGVVEGVLAGNPPRARIAFSDGVRTVAVMPEFIRVVSE